MLKEFIDYSRTLDGRKDFDASAAALDALWVQVIAMRRFSMIERPLCGIDI